MALEPIIIKNGGGSSQTISDLGITIAGYSQESFGTLWEIRRVLQSENLRTLCNAGLLVLNDGFKDIPVAEVDEFLEYFEAGTAPMNAPHRFPNKTETTISFSNAQRRFTITPTGTKFRVYVGGSLLIKQTEYVDITDTEGTWFFYFNASGVLTASQTVWNLQQHVPVAFIYWNAAADVALILGDERHGTVMDSMTHEMLHKTVGTRYASGLALVGTVGDGSLASHAQVSLSDGQCYDEDLPINIVDGSPQELTPIAYVPVFYLDGASPVWRKKTANTFPVYEGTNRIRYNLNTTGTWSQPDASTNGNYVAMFLFATNDVNTPVIAVLGQRQDTTLNGARDNNKLESLVFPNIPFQETKALWRIIFQTSAVYGNTPKARFIEALDLRASGNLVGGVYTPPPSPTNVYGLYHADAETIGSNQSTSEYPTYEDVLTLNAGFVPAGKYKLEYSAQIRCPNSISNECYYRIKMVGTSEVQGEYNIEAKDTKDYYFAAGFKILTLAAGYYSFTWAHCIDDNAATVESKNVRLEFYRVE